MLDGLEEDLTNYNCPITIDWRRNAVRVPKSTQFRTEINLLNAARDALMVWESEKIRDDIIHALAGVVTDTDGTVVPWDQATAANQNTWVAANKDRVLFGSLNSNYSGDPGHRVRQHRHHGEDARWRTSPWPSASPSSPTRASARSGPPPATDGNSTSPSTARAPSAT